jgi:hypothetical protein
MTTTARHSFSFFVAGFGIHAEAQSTLINFATEAFNLVFDLEFSTLEVNDLQVVNRLVKHCVRDLIFQSLVALLQIR